MPSTIAKTKTGIGSQAKIWDDNGVFAVQLHSTVVYKESDNKITLCNGGWITPTTVRYMNQALAYRGHAQGVAIRKGEMVLLTSRLKESIPFQDGTLTIETHGSPSI